MIIRSAFLPAYKAGHPADLPVNEVKVRVTTPVPSIGHTMGLKSITLPPYSKQNRLPNPDLKTIFMTIFLVRPAFFRPDSTLLEENSHYLRASVFLAPWSEVPMTAVVDRTPKHSGTNLSRNRRDDIPILQVPFRKAYESLLS